jgi:hypothetical protein
LKANTEHSKKSKLMRGFHRYIGIPLKVWGNLLKILFGVELPTTI